MPNSLTFDMDEMQQHTSDPLAFMSGFIHGFTRKVDVEDEPQNNSVEYTRGVHYGYEVACGIRELPAWVHTVDTQ